MSHDVAVMPELRPRPRALRTSEAMKFKGGASSSYDMPTVSLIGQGFSQV